jgi:hypothetical protein
MRRAKYTWAFHGAAHTIVNLLPWMLVVGLAIIFGNEYAWAWALGGLCVGGVTIKIK